MRNFVFALLIVLLTAMPALPAPKLVDMGKEIVENAELYIGLKEKSNRNDHPQIDEFLRYCGLNPGYAWCQAFYNYNAWEAFSARSLQTPFSRSASVAKQAQFAMNNPLTLKVCTYKMVNMGMCEPEPGDLASWKHGKAAEVETYNYQGHAGVVERWDGRYVYTIEGNTPPTNKGTQRGSAEGDLSAGNDGVYRKTRSLGFGSTFPILYFIRPVDRIFEEEE